MFTAINTPMTEYWRATRYREEDVWEVGREIDDRSMAALVTFQGEDTRVCLSTATWRRQQGHYPTIMEYFRGVARHPLMEGKTGVVLVWLEDGMWLSDAYLSQRAPILAFGRHIQDQHTALIPDPAFISEIGYRAIMLEHDRLEPIVPWSERVPSLFWRGAATGDGLSLEHWRSSPRCRLALHSRDLDNSMVLDAKITKCSHLPEDLQEAMKQEGIIGDPVPFTRFLGYKYLIDVDGYACAWKSLFLKLASGSVTVKVNSPLEQWYFRHLVPWKHYIPITGELNEIREIHAWLLAHDENAHQMAKEARALADTITFGESFEAVVELCTQLLDCQIPASPYCTNGSV